MSDTVSFLRNLIKNNPKFAPFENDLGIELIASSLDYKINAVKEQISSDINEFYNPQSEIILLSKLMNEIAYTRFKKPLKIKASALSSETIVLNQNTRFTDGENLFYLDDLQSLQADTARDIYLTLKQIVNKTVTIEDSTLYFKIPTEKTYKELVEVVVSKDGTNLIYSQNFIKSNSEYSYEIKSDGTIWICLFLGVQEASDLKSGDVLDVEIITTSDVSLSPTGLGIIENGFNLVLDNITVESNYEPYMSIEEMQSYVMYGRANIGDLILSEDYRQHILRNISNIDEIKVWQEAEEEKEVGVSLTHINKVFVSYIHYDGLNIDNEIISTVQDAIHGKEAVVKDAIIIDLTVSIVLKSRDNINSELQNNLKAEIAGTYDDIYSTISNASIYSKCFKFFSSISDIDIEVMLSNKGAYKNRNFFRVLYENISITVQPK